MTKGGLSACCDSEASSELQKFLNSLLFVLPRQPEFSSGSHTNLVLMRCDFETTLRKAKCDISE